jgi:hypothetical protein
MVIHDRLVLIQAALHGSADGASDTDERRDERIIATVEQLLDGPIDYRAAWDVADSLKKLLPDGSVTGATVSVRRYRDATRFSRLSAAS